MRVGERSDWKAPPLMLLAHEGLAIVLPCLSPILPAVTSAQVAGGGVPVLVFPGLLSGDATTSRLRRSLDSAGFRSYGWEIGLNFGLRPGMMERCRQRLEQVAASSGQPVILLGWSLGGLFSREIARLRPDLVRCVVTLGTPFSGDAHGNNAWRVYEWLNDHKVDALPIEADLAAKPPVPTIAVWSRSDGIISPASARGLRGESDRTVEIRSTRNGMGTSARPIRDVVAVVLSCLG